MRFVKKSNLGKIIIFLTSIILALLFLEIAFRIVGMRKGIDFRLYAKELKNSDRLPSGLFDDGRLRANAEVLAATSDFSVVYSINSKGMRDKEYSYEKHADEVRIGMFGDSFTFGEGVPYGKRFSEIIENNLPGLEVLNFGFPGYGLDHVTTLIFNEGLKYQLDYIVVVLNRYVIKRGGGDILGLLDYPASDAAEMANKYKSDSETMYLKREDAFFDFQPNILLRHSYALSYLHYWVSLQSLKSRMAEHDRTFWDVINSCDNDPKCDIAENIDLQFRTVELLNKLNEVASASGATLVVVNIDSQPLEYFYKNKPPFKYYDLNEDLYMEGQKYKLSFTYDHHYNERTNKFLGAKMTEMMKDLIGK